MDRIAAIEIGLIVAALMVIVACVVGRHLERRRQEDDKWRFVDEHYVQPLKAQREGR